MRLILVNIVFMCFSFSLIGQDSLQTKQKSFLLKTDVLWPAISFITKRPNVKFPSVENIVSLSLEHTTFKNQSVQLTGFYVFYSINKTDPGSLTFSSPSGIFIANGEYKIKASEKTMILFPQYRFYIALRKKFYLGPYLKYSYFRHKALEQYYYNNITYMLDESDIIQHAGAMGGLAGFQFFIKKRISVDFYAGLDLPVYFAQRDIKGHYYYSDETHYGGLISFNVGYRFIHKWK